MNSNIVLDDLEIWFRNIQEGETYILNVCPNWIV